MKERKGRLQRLLKAASFEKHTLEDTRLVDFESLAGMTLSYSVTPVRDDSDYKPMMDVLRALFEKHQLNGKVQFEFLTEVQFARLQSFNGG